MESLSLFLDIKKFLISSEKMLLAELKRYAKYFMYFWIFFSHCVTDLVRWVFLAPGHPWAAQKKLILNRVKNTEVRRKLWYSYKITYKNNMSIQYL